MGVCGQVFCDENGHTLHFLLENALALQLELDRQMRVFYRYHFMHQ